jgi:hypothetical protein
VGSDNTSNETVLVSKAKSGEMLNGNGAKSNGNGHIEEEEQKVNFCEYIHNPTDLLHSRKLKR